MPVDEFFFCEIRKLCDAHVKMDFPVLEPLAQLVNSSQVVLEDFEPEQVFLG